MGVEGWLVRFVIIMNSVMLGFGAPNQGQSSSSCYLWYPESSNKTLLPQSEAKALENMMLNISVNEPDYTSSCNNAYKRLVTIYCGCDNDSSPILCHIIRIRISGFEFSGFCFEGLSKLTQLTLLSLSYNKLAGSIPDSVGDLSTLQYLDLSNNQLNGSIPKSLSKLKNLINLYLSQNFLNGSIPTSIADLKSLIEIDLSTNMLSGPIPDFLGNLTYLESLTLYENQFNGTLPPVLGNLRNLTTMDFGSNNLTGSIPEEYGQLTKFKNLWVDGNNLSGNIPSFIGKWTSLEELDLTGNNFEGELPPQVFSFPNLTRLAITDLRNSTFKFPPSLNLPKLETLRLRNCSILGVIPPYIGQLSSLESLDLSFNHIYGQVPNSLQNLTELEEISLAGNNLTGTFPIWAAKEDSLTVDLSYNYLQVNEKLNLKRRDNMNLFDCCSTSSEEPQITSPKIIKAHCPNNKNSNYNSLFINCGGNDQRIDNNIFVADNHTSSSYVSPDGKWAYSCSGLLSSPNDSTKKTECGISDVDAPLYGTARLCPVSLTYYGFCLRNGDYNVILYFSEIVYATTEDYNIDRFRVFDVYIQDQLREPDLNIKERAGGARKAWNKTYSNVHVSDSELKIRLVWAGKGSTYDSKIGPLISAIAATAVEGKGKLKPLHIALITLSSVTFILLLSLCLFWKFWWRKDNDLKGKHVEIRGRSVPVKRLIEATRNFSPKMVIGKGGFGTVYRAELFNQIVAVKKLSSQSRQGMDEFRNEIYALKTLQHENLVQLLDGYSGKDLHFLIYEYMENNSLARALFGSDFTLELNWETRYEICMGIARGLKYLHEDSRIKIVHRDIKASNILLDANLKAKIADFGLARLYDREENHTMVTKVGGTHGYMAPEYAMRGLLTDKADVYSFGVLLLEIVSGKNNAEYKMNQESVFLLDTAYVLHKKGRLIELVDKKLSRYNVEQAKTVLGLGMICTSQSLTLRPTISEVVSVLEGEKTIEQVSGDHAPSPSAGYERNVAYGDMSMTDFSNISSQGTSGSSTSYFVIRERNEKEPNIGPAEGTSALEISKESNM